MAINNTAREIASGMAYLHNMDILHGDLTAGNILLSSADAADARGFNAKVADFGLSRVMVRQPSQLHVRRCANFAGMYTLLLLNHARDLLPAFSLRHPFSSCPSCSVVAGSGMDPSC